jgi:uncharacterized protein YjiS (DUF1127 family)
MAMDTINAAALTKQLNAHARATRSNAIAKKPGLLQALTIGWKTRWRQRRDEAWLRGQPDYLLRDIGVGRNEIEAIIRKGRYR